MKRAFIRFFTGLLLICLFGPFIWLLAYQWDRQIAMLDSAGGAEATEPSSLYCLSPDSGVCQVSYYSKPEHGRPTASGEIYDSLAMTCAVEGGLGINYGDNLLLIYGDKSVIVMVNDRMSRATCKAYPERDIDISQAAASRLGILERGVAYMKWHKLKRGKQ